MSIDLVTGGAGFIGSHLVRRLLGEGRRVRVVDDLSTGKRARLDEVANVIDLVVADLTTADLDPLLRDVAHVFHLAAVPSVPRSVADPLTSHRSIATATLRLLIAARDAGVERFVLSSSSSVYGNADVSPKHEGLPIRPISPYAVAKAAAEGYARTFAQLYDLNTISLRYFNVFGPSQDETSAYAAVIPLFIRRALAEKPLQVHGDGTQTRDFTYVENAVDANVAAATSGAPPGGVYNVAAGDPRSVNDLIAALARCFGRDLAVSYGPARAGDVKHSHADTSAAQRELGWRPTVAFEEGLRRTVEWYSR